MAVPVLAQVERTPAKAVALPIGAASRLDVTAGVVSAKVERLAVDRAALTLQTRLAPSELRLLDTAGKDVAVTTSPDGTLKANVDPRRGYILTPRAVASRPLTKEGVQFPARYVTFGPSGAANLGGLFLRPAVVPLTWSESARAYATELLVGYEFEDGGERRLAAPKTVTFFAEGPSARIQADSITIESSGGSGYKRVVLSTGQLEGETRFTARVGPGDELHSSVGIFREPGGLTLAMGATRLPAFGVGSGTLTIARLGRDGQPLAASSPLEVQLTSRDLRQPASIIIPAGESRAEAKVRTAGLGTDEIMAQSGTFQAVLPIEAVFPTAPIIAAVIGGILGGAARYLRNRRRSTPLLLRRLLEGALVGVILVAAAWAGLVAANLSTGVFGTPFGAFVLAALSGYLGCIVLDRVANKTFRPVAVENSSK